MTVFVSNYNSLDMEIHVRMTADFSTEDFGALQGCIQTFPDWVDKEIKAYNSKHSLRGNTKCYSGKTH
jgi:hypothetical protein